MPQMQMMAKNSGVDFTALSFSKFAFKFGVEKLISITSGVCLYQNKVETEIESFFKKMVKSELSTE